MAPNRRDNSPSADAPRPAPAAAAAPPRVGTQYGALCFRRHSGKIQLLLVSSRNTGRWVVPKGWPMPDTEPSAAAQIEAWEEAGVIGQVSSACIGLYSYVKRADSRWPVDTPCVVELFPLHVTHLKHHFPERSQRRRHWFSRRKAAARVDEPGLQRLIHEFRPELYFG